MLSAAIDVGSNTLRMLIGSAEEDMLSRIYLDRAITRLAEGVRETGMLSEENMEKSLSVLKRFSHTIERYGVTDVKAIGTSALREAENSSDFIERVLRETGIRIEIISGEEEAGLTAKGVMLGLRDVTAAKSVEPLLIIDIGGGSTEWIIYGKDTSHGTIPAGVVNLYEKFIKTDPPSHDEISALNREIDLSLERDILKQACPEEILNQVQNDTFRVQHDISITNLIGTGGTITTLASIDLGLKEYNPERIHGHTLSLERLYQIRDKLISLPFKERQAIPGLEIERADLIIPGILLTIRITEISGCGEIMVSDYGLLEGIMITMMAGR
ncbi:MAG: bifunctional 3-dehydroquinate synthase/phosphatase [Thermodesulfovibrionales bacterium]